VITVACDMSPLHYLILIGCDHVLPAMFDRVLTARVVVEEEMNDPRTPELVRRWAANPPHWLEVRDPKRIEHLPSLGRVGERGDGDRAVISLALEARADFVLMDDNKARKQVLAKAREHDQKMEPLWTLEVLDEAAERRLINDLPERLLALEHQTAFYVGEKAQRVIKDMLRRDLERKKVQE
jgi:predicted nucleic acid-binding protein